MKTFHRKLTYPCIFLAISIGKKCHSSRLVKMFTMTVVDLAARGGKKHEIYVTAFGGHLFYD